MLQFLLWQWWHYMTPYHKIRYQTMPHDHSWHNLTSHYMAWHAWHATHHISWHKIYCITPVSNRTNRSHCMHCTTHKHPLHRQDQWNHVGIDTEKNLLCSFLHWDKDRSLWKILQTTTHTCTTIDNLPDFPHNYTPHSCMQVESDMYNSCPTTNPVNWMQCE